MAHVTAETAERISQYVLDCSIGRLTFQETAEFLKLKGFPVDVRTVKRYRARIRDSAQSWIARLAKSRRAEYIYEYRLRIDEILKCTAELWKIHNDKNTTQPAKIMALAKIMDATMKLTQLYDVLLVIASIKHYDIFEKPEEHPVVKAVRDKDFSFSHPPTTTSPWLYGSNSNSNSSDDQDKNSDSGLRDSYSDSNININTTYITFV